MKKLLTILTLLLMALTTAWAGEKTVVISANDMSGVNYAERDGIVFTFTGGLNNDNYLLYNPNSTANTVLSYNYVIKKIVFHCIDNAVEGDLDSDYWGPSTIYEIHGRGSYTYSDYIGVWTGSETQLTFGVKGHGVRFGSVEVTYEKLEGDIFDLVTNLNQIEQNKSYIIVSQTYDKVMRYKATEDFTHPSTDIVAWPLGNSNKTKVKVDGRARIFKLTNVTDSTINNIARKNAFLNILNGFICQNFSNNLYLTKDNLPSQTDYNKREYFRGKMYFGNAYNYLLRFSNGNMVRYNYETQDFRIMGTSDANTRVWLYKQAETFNVFTKSNPTAGGTIVLGDGVVDNTSQHYETVNFTITENANYILKSVVVNEVDVNNNTLGNVVPHSVDGNGNYSFTMPENHVRITAEFELSLPHTISVYRNPDAGGYYDYIKYDDTYHNDIINIGSIFYKGNDVEFMVKTNQGYRIDNVKMSYNDGSQTIEETLIPTHEYADGKVYNFTMPDYDVRLDAYFRVAEYDLFLLGTHNGNTGWHSFGPKFNYDADNQKYWIDVYYKGVNTAYGQGTSNEGDKYGYFSITKEVKGNVTDGDNWTISGRFGSSNGNNYKILGDYGSSITTATGGLTSGENAFMIPAGVYRIEVTKDNNDNPSQVIVTRSDVGLELYPTGGTNAASAAELSWGSEVTMVSDIQNKVRNIANAYSAAYPQYIPDNFSEDNVSYNYSIAETTDLNITTQSGTPPYDSPKFTLVNYNVAVDEPITVKVDGNAWIGWIHAPATSYYKVINTPLHWIEHPDKGVQGNNYIVSDQLMGVYAMGNILWAKDVDYYSNNANSYDNNSGAIDYMKNFATFMAVEAPSGMQSNLTNVDEWEQHNWVQLDFSEIENGDLYTNSLQNKYFVAGSVKGTYADNQNYRIVLSELPTTVEGVLVNYQPNYYCPVNFMTYQGVPTADGYDSSLDVSVFTSNIQGSTKSYYFLNPKIQEYALITFAVWDGTRFVVSDQSSSFVNGANLNGAFDVDWTYNNWDTDNDADQTSNLNDNLSVDGDNVTSQHYIFHAIIQKPVAQQGNGAPARVGEVVTPKPGQTPTGNYKVYPLDLVASSDNNIITAVSRLDTAKAVQSVTYSDLAGRTSSKPFAGVNIVITRYTDGTIVTSKQVR